LAQNTVLKKPTRVQQAQGSLDIAVARLEAAVRRRADAAGAGAEPDQRITQLQAEVDDLQARNRQLKEINAQVSGRIDGVIANLKTTLEG
jgi:chromosome segregation ATPase